MKVILALLISTYTISALAAEYPKNIFVAYDERVNKKLTGELPVDLSEPARFFVSRPNDVGPETILISAQVMNAPVEADPTNPKDFPSLSIHLGRSGNVHIRRNSDGSCTVRSTLREFFYPNETRFEICSYFYATGTKPGLSGSN